jgi:hypothetical protein
MSKIVDITPSGTGFPSFDTGAWGVPVAVGDVATGSPVATTGQADEAVCLPLSRGRVLMYYWESNNYPTVQIGATAAPVGTAQVIVTTSYPLMFWKKLTGIDSFIFGINNDLYLIECGSSGTTVTVTQISTDAGDAGRGEAFRKDFTDILLDRDNGYFVICNEFSNGGTRSFVSALYTLDLTGTPSATFVTRDVDATGDANLLTAAFAANSSTNGRGIYLGASNASSTVIRCNIVTFTVSTVSNSVSSVTPTIDNFANIATIQTRYNSRAYAGYDYLSFLVTLGTVGNPRSNIYIDYSSSPALVYQDSPLPTNTTSAARGQTVTNAESVGVFANFVTSDASVQISMLIGSILTHSVGSLISLTTPTAYAQCFSTDNNYLYVFCKTSTDTGTLVVFKSGAVP